MTKTTNKAQRAAIKAAVERSMLFLVTGPNRYEHHRAYNRLLMDYHLRAASEQALLAGSVELALRINDISAGVDPEPREPDGAPEPTPRPRRKLVRAGSPGSRAKAKLIKRGALSVSI